MREGRGCFLFAQDAGESEPWGFQCVVCVSAFTFLNSEHQGRYGGRNPPKYPSVRVSRCSFTQSCRTCTMWFTKFQPRTWLKIPCWSVEMSDGLLRSVFKWCPLCVLTGGYIYFQMYLSFCWMSSRPRSLNKIGRFANECSCKSRPVSHFKTIHIHIKHVLVCCLSVCDMCMCAFCRVKLWASAFGGEMKSISAKYSGSQLLQKVSSFIIWRQLKVSNWKYPLGPENSHNIILMSEWLSSKGAPLSLKYVFFN